MAAGSTDQNEVMLKCGGNINIGLVFYSVLSYDCKSIEEFHDETFILAESPAQVDTVGLLIPVSFLPVRQRSPARHFPALLTSGPPVLPQRRGEKARAMKAEEAEHVESFKQWGE